MTEMTPRTRDPLRPTAEQIAAARLRIVLNRRTGKPTSPTVEMIARAEPADDAPSHPITSPSRAEALTARQQRVLEVIRDYLDQHGYPPSVREIGEAVGLTSTSSVAIQLRALERKGYLRPDPTRPRAVGTLVSMAASVPVVGRIAAGGTLLTDESDDEAFALPREIVGDGTLFLLLVTDDSMRAAGIAQGDWAVIRQQSTAENGDIIAAAIDGETTIRRFTVPGDNAVILGRLVAILRRL